jgi:hypothetical protein
MMYAAAPSDVASSLSRKHRGKRKLGKHISGHTATMLMLSKKAPRPKMVVSLEPPQEHDYIVRLL